jgi:hypothetical protein
MNQTSLSPQSTPFIPINLQQKSPNKKLSKIIQMNKFETALKKINHPITKLPIPNKEFQSNTKIMKKLLLKIKLPSIQVK